LFTAKNVFLQGLPDLWPYHLLFPAIAKKLTHFAHVELAPLMEVSGLKQVIMHGV